MKTETTPCNGTCEICDCNKKPKQIDKTKTS